MPSYPCLHAIKGSITTSRAFGVGKPQALKRLASNVLLQECGEIFTKVLNATEVIGAGVTSLLVLYGGVYVA